MRGGYGEAGRKIVSLPTTSGIGARSDVNRARTYDALPSTTHAPPRPTWIYPSAPTKRASSFVYWKRGRPPCVPSSKRPRLDGKM